jgi:N-acetylneuraminate lyase
MNNDFWITGLVPAVFTPMHEDGSLNLPMIDKLVEYTVSQNVSAIYVCGSTGEGPSLSTEERMAVTEAYLNAVKGRIPVIVQVGHDSLKQSQKLAEHAQAKGATAISAAPPTYFKIDSLDLLVDFLAEIVAAAPELPFYYYHIPRLTAVKIDVVKFLEVNSTRIPNLKGVKYSDFTIYELQACIDLFEGKYNILFGSDEMLLSGLVGGAHGAVGSTFNFAAPLYHRIIRAFQEGDIPEARRLQGLSVKMVHYLNRYGSPSSNGPTIKAMMKMIGFDCGPMRLPQQSVSLETFAQLQKAMEKIGFFNWGCK